MFGNKPDGYPQTPTLDELKDKISRMKLTTLGGFLGDIAHCRIPLKLIIDNEPLVERFIGKKRRRDEDEIYELVRWLKKKYAKPGAEELELMIKLEDDPTDTETEEKINNLKMARESKLEMPLWPSNDLFALYADVDMDEVEKEKRAVLEWQREQIQMMTGEKPAGFHAELPDFDPNKAS